MGCLVGSVPDVTILRKANCNKHFILTFIGTPIHILYHSVFLFSHHIHYFFQREFDRGIQDCDSALYVSEGSRRALYRKALCLRELGRLREAYECGTKCLLTAPHVGYFKM